MTVKEAITALQKLHPDAQLMVASLGHGGSVPLQGFHDLDARECDPPVHWIDVVYCEDHERKQYGLSAVTAASTAAPTFSHDEILDATLNAEADRIAECEDQQAIDRHYNEE